MNVVITIGKEGALLYMPKADMDPLHIPAPSVKTVDTTGAGDAFCGTFSYGISKGLSPEGSVRLANKVAAESVKKTGTQISYPRGERLKEIVDNALGD